MVLKEFSNKEMKEQNYLRTAKKLIVLVKKVCELLSQQDLEKANWSQVLSHLESL